MKCMAAAVVTLKLISAGNYVQDKCGIYCRPSSKTVSALECSISFVFFVYVLLVSERITFRQFLILIFYS